jgi:glucose/arabinose dehydrogenase
MHACVGVAGLMMGSSALAQSSASSAALRFYGTGIGPPGQQDRVRIQIDDDAPGPDASAPCDVGSGSFTIEFWMRGTLADNSTGNSGGDIECFCNNWISGNIIVDRDIFNGTDRDWGISIAGGFVRFGVGPGNAGGAVDVTVEGNVNALDGQWHHVACVRDFSAGQLRVYVDGALDFAGSAGANFADVSYPNNGDPGQATPWGPYIVIAAEKHDAGAAFPSFNGYVDEFRVWNRALSQRDLLDVFDRTLTNASPLGSGLVAAYRFEEGSGTSVSDTSGAGSPTGQLIAGIPGNGEWALRSMSPMNVAAVSSGALPAGFVRTQVTAGLTEPTVIEFLPDGRLLIGERDGTILIHQGGMLLGTPLIQLAANVEGGERGLVGMTIDPNFATNGFLYCYYTTNEPRNRVGRFTVVGNTASPATEFLVWQNPAIAADYHHGGTIRFGMDGNLYIATGDQFDSANSQNPGNQHGKLLRVRPDGTIPPDNPFVGNPAFQAAIWALGLRNPFRFTVDPPTGNVWIGDVGGNNFDSWEEINRAAAGANFGWPNQEGALCYVGDCSAYTFSIYSYQHNDPRYFTGGFNQGSISLGPVYRSSGAGAFPSVFRESLYFGDYANRWIRRLVFDGAGAVIGDPLFLAAPDAGTIVDLEVGPDGALYYVNIGIPWSGSADTAAVYRVSYAGFTNQSPIVAASATPTEGPTPLNVQFSSVGTTDPDSGPSPLTYGWEFGDGGMSSAANPSHVYTIPGPYQGRLTVSDGAAMVSSDFITVYAGNRPSASIDAPPAGTMYSAGEMIGFSGSASDDEDGVLPASAFTWQVVLVHAGHTHPFFGPVSGVTGGSVTIPTTGHEPENTSYQIILTVADSHGLPRTVTRDLTPRSSPLFLSTDPPGIPVFLDGVVQSTPRNYTSLLNYSHAVEAQQQFTLGGTVYTFACWSNFQPRVHSFVMPAAGRTLIARYSASGSATVSSPIAAANRNADWYTPAGTAFGNFYNANQVCVGSDGGGQFQMGLGFALAVPQGATVTSAAIEMVATADNTGSPQARIRGYNVDSAPVFIAGSPTPLVAFAPVTAASVTWSPPAFTGGVMYATPDLSAVVQAVVSRPGWAAGNFIGFVLDPLSSGDQWRCVRNFAAGQAPVLRVTYATAGAAACCLPGDANGDRAVTFADVTAVLANFGAAYFGVIGAGDANGDGLVNFADVTAVLAGFGGACL